jgi:hypothetical protein
VVVFGYVLNGLRGGLLGFWSSSSRRWWSWGFRRFGEEIQRYRYRRLRSSSQRTSPWDRVFTEFSDRVDRLYDAGGQHLHPEQEKKLLRLAQAACWARYAGTAAARLGAIEAAYGEYFGNDLGEVFATIKRELSDRHRHEKMRLQALTAELDRRFGSLETVRATALGNVIESYLVYPWKRYQIEAEIFWPRLRHVLSEKYAPLVADQQTLLDFSVTMASLAAIYGLLALLAGPWLWFRPWFWPAVAGVAFLVSGFFYRLAVQTALGFGDLVRSSFDLFRLDLMAALHRPDPATLFAERAQWTELSELVVYGQAVDFSLVETKGKP